MPALSENQLVFKSMDKTVGFRWIGDSLKNRFEPHAYMLLPIELENCPKVFYMQFDLGAPNSILYSGMIGQIREEYPKAISSMDTVSVTDFHFWIEELDVVAKEIKLTSHGQSKINWKEDAGISIIGTIGADLIDGHVVVIDYPAEKLFIGKEVPHGLLPRLELTDMIFERRTVLLPAKLKGENIRVFFDTGSSAYELLTDRQTAEALASDTLPERNEVASWGRTLVANTLQTSNTIEFAGQTIPLKHVTYMEGVSDTQVAQMKKIGIGGMTGNKLFVESILVLDTRNRKFGVIPSNQNSFP